jgi:hypothetical protein
MYRAAPLQRASIALWCTASLAVVASAYAVQLRRENARLTQSLAVCGAPGETSLSSDGWSSPPRASGGPARVLSAEQRKAMITRLQGTGQTGNAVWFSTVANDPEAAALQRSLASAFQEAGWALKGNRSPEFAVKPGLYVFLADDEPPGWTEAAVSALEAAGLSPTVGRGYRSFYQEMKTSKPGWTGFEMASDQAFLIVIGPRATAP